MARIPLPLGLKLKVAVALTCLKEDLGYLRHYRAGQSTHPEHKTILKDLHQKGYHVLRGYWDRTACSDAATEIDAIVANYPDRLQVDPEHSDHRIWGGERASAKVHRFYDDPTLSGLATSYLHTDVGNITTLAAKVVAKPENKGSGGGWHRDSMYERQIKAIMYLSDVSADNGPFQYVAGSNTKRSVLETLSLHDGPSLKRFSDKGIEEWCGREGCPVETITGSAGDVILVDTRGVHRGKPIVSGTRYALTNYYAAAHRFDDHHSGFARLIKF